MQGLGLGLGCPADALSGARQRRHRASHGGAASALPPPAPANPPLRHTAPGPGPGLERGGLGLVGLVGGRPAGLQHLLHEVEADARFALVLGDGEVVEQVEVAHVGAVRVPVLVHQPLPLGGVGVARPDVLGLQVLQLAVDGVTVRHGGGGEEQERAEMAERK